MSAQDKEMPMRVAIIENTAVTHHGQVGVALHEAAARIDLWKPWRVRVYPLKRPFGAFFLCVALYRTYGTLTALYLYTGH